MGTIFTLMENERDRLMSAERLYSEEIDGLPRGKPRTKLISGKEYLYLNRREGAKIVDEYIGRADSEKAIAVLALVVERDRLIQLRKETRKRLKEVERVLRGKR
jgi:hypothetical protein